MITKEHINQAIENAMYGKSNLTEDVLSIRGFSTKTIRMLINNLTNTECTYLESGLLCGATFVSSFNKDCISVGLEDFSQNFQADIPGYGKEELQKNVDNNAGIAKEVHVHYESFLDIRKDLLPNDIDIYFYDGEHGIECQSVALSEFFDNMADQFVYMVDDASWPTVSDGTGVGFKFLRNKMWVEEKWELGKGLTYDPMWHNGVNLYLIRKK